MYHQTTLSSWNTVDLDTKVNEFVNNLDENLRVTVGEIVIVPAYHEVVDNKTTYYPVRYMQRVIWRT